MAKLLLIWVKGTKFNDKKLKNTVVLFERHPDHPNNGECFISHDGLKYQVAETARIKQLIGEGLLERVSWNSSTSVESKPVPAKNVSAKRGKGKPKTLRPATEREKDNALPPLEDEGVEDDTAVVEE